MVFSAGSILNLSEIYLFKETGFWLFYRRTLPDTLLRVFGSVAADTRFFGLDNYGCRAEATGRGSELVSVVFESCGA